MLGLLRRQREGKRTRTTGPASVPAPPHAGLLSCRVLDPVGDPLPAADLRVTDPAGRKVVSGESDPYGMFVVAVPPGDYRVAVESEGLTPFRGEIHVTEGAVAQLGDLVMLPAQLPQLPPPGDWEVDPAHTTIGFTARHIGMARVRGRFNGYRGALRIGRRMEDSQLHIVIDSASIDTNIKMRDDHLRSADFLDVERFPTLEFFSERFVHRAGNRWAVTGVLTLHGVSRTVTLDVDYLGIGTGLEGELRAACRATTELHREDFTLNWQHMLARGIAVVGSSIRIELDIQIVAAS
ncbi:Protein YceI [Streptomyces sp. RB5]|uniref:Protein YceI n=1 Tax=Streptomyces smaragdinus TaxID=2585196 RepID=A0A7K0CDP0_9ACTN|nr:YceI family protein [Streptomyces smaragdinus]MQY11589.1 Protein YceI [Streptomyces smaragdinus]